MEAITRIRAASAAAIAPTTLDQWISREYFTPEHDPHPGTARQFSVADVVRLVAMADLTRMGYPAAQAGKLTADFRYYYEDDTSFLAIVSEVVPLVPPGSPLDMQAYRRGERPELMTDQVDVFATCIRRRDILPLLASPVVRGLTLLSVDLIKARVERRAND